MRTQQLPRPITAKQLDAWRKCDWRKIAGNWEPAVRQMIDELTGLRLYVAALEPRYLANRASLVELDRDVTPAGRVLVVDCPAVPGERCEGETVIYADCKLDVAMVSCPVGTMHPMFDEVLEAVLARSPRRFQGMHEDLAIRSRSLTRYPRDLRREAIELLDAKLADNVITALNEIREEFNEAKPTAAENGIATNAVQAEAGQAAETVAVETKVEGPGPARAQTRPSAPSVPW